MVILHACSGFIEFIKPVDERDKMRDLLSILSLFRNKLNKYNNTGAQMLDSIYHMTFKLLKNHIFGVKVCQDFAIFYGHHYVTLLNL